MSSGFHILIKRDTAQGDLVPGRIYLDGDLLGTTFERTAVKIPAGDYKGLMRYRSSHHFVQGEPTSCYIPAISRGIQTDAYCWVPSQAPKAKKGSSTALEVRAHYDDFVWRSTEQTFLSQAPTSRF